MLEGFARRLGYHPVATERGPPVPDAVFERASPMPGVAFDLDAQLRFLEVELGSFLTKPLGDAEVAFAMTRWLRPRRVVEVGLSYATGVLRDALARNGDGATHVVLDPSDACQVDDDVLLAADLLFIDSTHVLTPGGEVNRLLLETLPSLDPGVVVHLHDIYLPYEYPRGIPWQEQYVLQALLCCADAFEVLAALHALYRQRPERFAANEPPTALWLRRA